MTKQLLFYEQVQPVSAKRHQSWSVRGEQDYGFAAATNIVPLTVAEFSAAAADYPIVFVTAGETVLPAAILGLEDGKSYFVSESGEWQAKYIPAYVRRYPFVLSPVDDGNKFVLCLDEAYAGWDKDGGQGLRLFDDGGETTSYLKDIQDFINRYHTEHSRSRKLAALLRDHELLAPMKLKIGPSEDNARSVRGFQAVDRDKLKDLESDLVVKWHKSGLLEAIHLHLWSVRNFQDLAGKMAGRAGAKISGRAVRRPPPEAEGAAGSNGAADVN